MVQGDNFHTPKGEEDGGHLVAKIKRLTRAEGRKLFSRTVRKYFDVKDGQEWLVQYIEGLYQDNPNINRVLILLPFAR